MSVQHAPYWLAVALAIVLAVAGVADVWLATAYGRDGTLSAFVWRLSADYPLVPFLVGLLCGHLFWRS
jgi:hypothetical protein